MQQSSNKGNVARLAIAQALSMTTMNVNIINTALVGSLLAPVAWLATLGLSLQFVASMLTTLPASLLMVRFGRRPVFIGGVLIAAVAAESPAWKAVTISVSESSAAGSVLERMSSILAVSVAIAAVLVAMSAVLVAISAVEDVANPAKAVSLAVSTLLINDTISANESLSASAEDKIASILAFSVSIVESIEELNAVKPVVPEIVTCSEPDINVGFPVTLPYATLSAVKPSKLPTPVKDPEKDPVASALVILGLCILIFFLFYAFVML